MFADRGWQRSKQYHNRSRIRSSRHYTLFMERLERRDLLTAVQETNDFNITGNVGEKPENKVWEYAGKWWSVLSDTTGSYVWRLDGLTWQNVFQLSNSTSVKADVKVVGDVAHVLIENDLNTKLSSIQYVPATDTYKFWDVRPATVDISLATGVEAATIDIDSTGRMWTAYDDDTHKIQARYSDFPYSTWSSPIALATNVTDDDISSVTVLPGKIGVMWSNQTTDRFGFRTHIDGTDPNTWTADEVPASQSALNVGQGMADDHINFAVPTSGPLA